MARHSRSVWVVAALHLAAVGSALLLPCPVSGQRGLVLSGGGARGIAHAGVVRGADSLGFDPDIVVGSSMGAIIGALYATGLSGASVWDTVAGQDLSAVFSPLPVLFATAAPRLPVLRVHLGEGRRSSTRGLVPEWAVNRLLTRTFFDASARARGDFDRLPRRFRAVAGDLSTGTAVVLADGDLAQAVRASMSIPGAFAAVERNDRLLIDGGVANYLPVGVARGLGARWILASDVIHPVGALEELSPVVIGSRGFHWLNVNARDDPEMADVTVTPILPPTVTAGSFMANLETVMFAGLDAVRDVELPPPADGRPRSREAPPRRLTDLVVSAPDDPGLRALLGEIFRDALGPYDPNRVLEAMDRAYATGLFDAVWPWVEGPSSTDGDALLRVRATPVAGTALLGGAGYDTDRRARAWASLRSVRRVGLTPALVTLSGGLGDFERDLSASAEVIPIRWAPLSVLMHGRASEVELRPSPPGLPLTDMRRMGGGIGLRYRSLGPDRALTGLLKAERVEGFGVDGLSVGPALRWEHVAPLGPALGLTPLVEGEWRLGTVDYWRIRARASWGGSLGRFDLVPSADVRLAGGGAPADVLPALGDEHLFPGLRWGEERGARAAIGGMDIGYPLPLGGILRLGVRGALLDGSEDLGTPDVEALGVELGTVWLTPFGGVELRAGANTLGGWRVDFAVGSLRR